MTVKKGKMSVEPKTVELNDLVVQGMAEKKAHDIVVLDLRNVKNAVADYFIICSGNSDTQIDAICDSVEEFVYKASKQSPWKKEGKQNKEWILLDYIDVVAHIFKKDKRDFYSLEELWGDAVITPVESSHN
ncbi:MULTISPECIES: ribosome silencing factor [unclassified Imperialibacter]|uniref:ribosome silencing factor n=1 Tax=unclassified Imperialibacter TaxID=2629706 RepID=UPI0012576929|nr:MULTISPECIES: ribosome silencing factor [unclassified Imperialibacter]CAD5254478.1 Ribosomal silencing factor RsfS [Imperialibacter sp. 75]CAD5262921.1 Ribosomal silencing factor RsfS [Imperialibacter sp. 89]VVT35354.1 Ribosomal silencing factor RsfS [Imperialibacter sp. EC-SDR9]